MKTNFATSEEYVLPSHCSTDFSHGLCDTKVTHLDVSSAQGGKKSENLKMLQRAVLSTLSFGPLLDKKKFPDFKSLWRMWRSWMYLRARMAWPSQFQTFKNILSITAAGEAWVNHRTTWSCGKIFEDDLARKSISQTFAKNMNSLKSPALRSWFCQPGRHPHSSPWRYIASHPLRNIDRSMTKTYTKTCENSKPQILTGFKPCHAAKCFGLMEALSVSHNVRVLQRC